MNDFLAGVLVGAGMVLLFWFIVWATSWSGRARDDG